MKDAARDMVHRCVSRRNTPATYMYTHWANGYESPNGVTISFFPAGAKLNTNAGDFRGVTIYDAGNPEDWKPGLLGQNKQSGIPKVQEPSRRGKTSGAGSRHG